MIRRTAVVSLVISLATGVAQAQMPAARVVVTEAKMMEAPDTQTLVGTVTASRISDVASEVAGIVEAMPIRQGDRVEAGGLICRLNGEALSFRLAEARADLESKRSQHEELLAGTRKEELTRLKAVRDEAVAEFDRWQFEMERVSRLFEGRDANEKEFKDTRSSYLAAERRKIAATASYDEAVAGPRKETIAQAAYDVAAQQAVVDRIASDVRKTEIVAPFTGYVVQRRTEVGEWVQAGGNVVQLADLSIALVRTDAPEAILPFLRVGAGARVWIDSLGRSFPGTIKHVIPAADLSARTFPVEVAVDNSEGMLAGGQFARVTLPAGSKGQVIAVPKDAIAEKDDVTYAGVVVPGRDGSDMGMLMPVTRGADVGEWVAITSGNIAPGQRVIIRGNERLLPFPTPVIIVTEDGTPVATGNSNKTD